MLFKRSALRKAIENNDTAQVIDLLARHPESARKGNPRHLISIALNKADDDIVLALGRAKFNLLENNGTGSALEEAASLARHGVIKAWAEEFPLLWSAQDLCKLLNIAVRKHDNETLRFLIDNQLADPDAMPGYWDKPLNIALSHKNAEAVQMLRAEIARREGLAAPVATPIHAARAATEWHMVDATTIMRVRDVTAAGYRLTDIFNFAMGTCTSVQRNLETDAETAVTIDLSTPAAAAATAEAHAKLVAAGGKPPALPRALHLAKPTGANDV